MEDRVSLNVVSIVILALLLLTRIPAMAAYLSIDNVNLAFALDRFDPRVHQPQPPGYPFFVGFASIVNFFFRNPVRTFTFISVLVSGLSLIMAFLLGNRMFSRWAGIAGAFLLVVNPVFWQSGLDGPLRPHLALFSLLTAYFGWRCWNGERQFAFWGAAAVGIGSGFRPDLLAFLFPIWLISTWVGTRSWVAVLKNLAFLIVIVTVWIVTLVVAMGGINTFLRIMLDYGVDQSRSESWVLGSSIMAWLRQINRLVIWNGLALIGWVWALPFFFANRQRVPIATSQSAFILIWLVPGLTLQALIHIGAPGHTLFSVPAFCVLGGYVLSFVPGRDLVLSCALIFNVMLFLDYFPLPAGVSESLTRGTPSLKNALLFGTFESSLGQVRWLDDVTRTTLKEIEEFTPPDRPSVIITTDTYVNQWFMNWRIGRYYLPDRDFWVLYGGEKRRAEHIRREVLIEMRNSNPLRVPIFREGRILWLIEPDSAFHRQLASVQKLKGGKYVFYSEITPDSPSFGIGEFEVLPSLFGFFPNQIGVGSKR